MEASRTAWKPPQLVSSQTFLDKGNQLGIGGVGVGEEVWVWGNGLPAGQGSWANSIIFGCTTGNVSY